MHISFGSSCPALIVLDDLDVLSPQREAPPSDSQLKVLARLSACMDSLHRDPPPDHVAVVATTHQLERVEPSLRVPGRFDKEVEIPVPTARDRREVSSILGAGCTGKWGALLPFLQTICLEVRLEPSPKASSPF